jgi:hypothetical protein
MSEARKSSVSALSLSVRKSTAKSLLHVVIVIAGYYLIYRYTSAETFIVVTENYTGNYLFIYETINMVWSYLYPVSAEHSGVLMFLLYLISRWLYMVYVCIPLYLFTKSMFHMEAERVIRAGEYSFNPRVFHLYLGLKKIPCIMFMLYCGCPVLNGLVDTTVVAGLALVQGYIKYVVKINTPPVI